MSAALALMLIEQYGPTMVGLCIKYGPTIVTWIEDAQSKGTLDADINAIGSGLASLIGSAQGLAGLAEGLGQIQGAAVDSPEMERVTGSKAR